MPRGECKFPVMEGQGFGISKDKEQGLAQKPDIKRDLRGASLKELEDEIETKGLEGMVWKSSPGPGTSYDNSGAPFKSAENKIRAERAESNARGLAETSAKRGEEAKRAAKRADLNKNYMNHYANEARHYYDKNKTARGIIKELERESDLHEANAVHATSRAAKAEEGLAKAAKRGRIGKIAAGIGVPAVAVGSYLMGRRNSQPEVKELGDGIEIKGAVNYLKHAAATAIPGSVVGAATGAASSPEGERLEGAKRGAVVGGLTGAAIGVGSRLKRSGAINASKASIDRSKMYMAAEEGGARQTLKDTIKNKPNVNYYKGPEGQQRYKERIKDIAGQIKKAKATRSRLEPELDAIGRKIESPNVKNSIAVGSASGGIAGVLGRKKEDPETKGIGSSAKRVVGEYVKGIPDAVEKIGSGIKKTAKHPAAQAATAAFAGSRLGASSGVKREFDKQTETKGGKIPFGASPQTTNPGETYENMPSMSSASAPMTSGGSSANTNTAYAQGASNSPTMLASEEPRTITKGRGSAKFAVGDKIKEKGILRRAGRKMGIEAGELIHSGLATGVPGAVMGSGVGAISGAASAEEGKRWEGAKRGAKRGAVAGGVAGTASLHTFKKLPRSLDRGIERIAGPVLVGAPVAAGIIAGRSKKIEEKGIVGDVLEHAKPLVNLADDVVQVGVRKAKNAFDDPGKKGFADDDSMIVNKKNIKEKGLLPARSVIRSGIGAATRGALPGAGVGAVTGALGDGEDRLGGAARGAVVGGTLGAVVPAGMAMAQRRRNNAAIKAGASAVRSATGVDKDAAKVALRKTLADSKNNIPVDTAQMMGGSAGGLGGSYRGKDENQFKGIDSIEEKGVITDAAKAVGKRIKNLGVKEEVKRVASPKKKAGYAPMVNPPNLADDPIRIELGNRKLGAYDKPLVLEPNYKGYKGKIVDKDAKVNRYMTAYEKVVDAVIPEAKKIATRQRLEKRIMKNNLRDVKNRGIEEKSIGSHLLAAGGGAILGGMAVGRSGKESGASGSSRDEIDYALGKDRLSSTKNGKPQLKKVGMKPIREKK
jgi:hypothetical protein